VSDQRSQQDAGIDVVPHPDHVAAFIGFVFKTIAAIAVLAFIAHVHDTKGAVANRRAGFETRFGNVGATFSVAIWTIAVPLIAILAGSGIKSTPSPGHVFTGFILGIGTSLLALLGVFLAARRVAASQHVHLPIREAIDLVRSNSPAWRWVGLGSLVVISAAPTESLLTTSGAGFAIFGIGYLTLLVTTIAAARSYATDFNETSDAIEQLEARWASTAAAVLQISASAWAAEGGVEQDGDDVVLCPIPTSAKLKATDVTALSRNVEQLGLPYRVESASADEIRLTPLTEDELAARENAQRFAAASGGLIVGLAPITDGDGAGADVVVDENPFAQKAAAVGDPFAMPAADTISPPPADPYDVFVDCASDNPFEN
jgi:hypothetical protein